MFDKEFESMSFLERIGFKSKKKFMNTIIIALIIVVIILSTYTPSNSVNSNQKQLSVVEIKNMAQEVDYESLFRYNESHIGKILVYEGKVVQVLSYEDTQDFRINVDNKSSFGSDIVYLYGYKGTRVLEGDFVKFYGEVKGLKEYTTVLGGQVTIPYLKSLHLEILNT